MKKMTLIVCLLLLSVSLFPQTGNAKEKNSFYFDQPATIWEESFPLGNGRIGMMPWGGVERERIVMNEISLWSGNPQDADNPEAQQYLSKIRQLLFEGKNDEAQRLMYRTFTCKGPGSGGKAYGKFQVFANLYVDFQYPDTLPAREYKRSLHLNSAVSTTSFQKGGVTYSRHYFTSFSNDVGFILLKADKKGAINCTVSLDRDERFDTKTKGERLEIFGQLDSDLPEGGMKYFGAVDVVNKKGKKTVNDKNITITDADEVLLIVGMATDYWKPNPETVCNKQIDQAKKINFNKAIASHSKQYAELFGRVDLLLEKNANSGLPMNKRLEAYQADPSDHDLVALYMQYGRYLLISSTRKGTLPPNLQGLWAPQINTPWNGDYHLNINLQMNLWPAETGNLPELLLPFTEYVKSLVKPGQKTAQVYYNSRGWVTHILGNVWGFTSPGEHPSWGATNTSGAWLCQHLWEHYVYTRDKDYLRDVYPVMKEAALFFTDMLVEDPNSHYLVTAPTTSPENAYLFKGKGVSICAGSTMDNQIVRELFTNTIHAASILNTDTDFSSVLSEKLKRIAPTRIGKYGQIMEWMEDYEEAEPHHRHVSQLYGLHPGYEMTYAQTPELMKAARTTLERRGDESTGWSMAWKINFWARLKDGNRAAKLVKDLLKPAGRSRGTYPNLFSAHPPMQIDGNFGGSAGIMEMLIQSHEIIDNHFSIELLPAIPDTWTSGSFHGLCVRGGGIVDLEWKDGKITFLKLTATTDNQFRIKGKWNLEEQIVDLKKGKSIQLKSK